MEFAISRLGYFYVYSTCIPDGLLIVLIQPLAIRIEDQMMELKF